MGFNRRRIISELFKPRTRREVRAIDELLEEYVRNIAQSAATPTSGPVSPDPKLMAIALVTGTSFAVVDQDVILVDDDSAGSTVTINLPAAATAKQYPRYIKKLGTTADVIIDANAAERSDDELTVTIVLEKAVIMVISDGTNWQIL